MTGPLPFTMQLPENGWQANEFLAVGNVRRRRSFEMRRSQLLLITLLSLISMLVYGQEAQPYITATTPLGAQRGTTATFTIDGFNLAGASDVLWTSPGIVGRVVLNSEQMREKAKLAEGQTGALIVDRATRNRLTIAVSIDATTPNGIYGFRIKTPLGTTNLGRIAIGSLPETAEREPNDSSATAQMISLPATVAGELGRKGDTDHFKFAAKAGQEIVFEVVAALIGSRIDSVLTLLDLSGRTLAANNDFDGRRDSLLAYTFKEDGEYILRIDDFEHEGRMGQYGYRLSIGDFPYLTSAFPFGIRAGSKSQIAVSGHNLKRDQVSVQAPAQTGWSESIALGFSSDRGESLNRLRLAVGSYPEFIETPGGSSPARPQPVSLPVTINGRIRDEREGAGQSTDYFRFSARKGQPLILEVAAQRLGSPLDSFIEIFDSKGQPVPRSLIRCVLETSVTLNDPDSGRRGLRILNWNGIDVNDYVLIGDEILKVEVLPKTPDEDVIFRGDGGSRIGFFDTTPETHAVNTPVYKVSIHPPGTLLPPNGLPVRTLYYRNDDGAPSLGKDSRLTFVAPSDGQYVVAIRDTRGQAGERFAYRLSIHEPEPDFLLNVDPENPNVPVGGQRPITVTATRLDDFDGDIRINILDLPRGFRASTATIRAGQVSTVVLLAADPDAKGSFPLRVEGVATINEREVKREVRTEDRLNVVSVAPPPELTVWTELREIAIPAGGQAYVTVNIKREQGFSGRVPVDVRNLPHGVIVKDVGLNGVLITETETTQRFILSVQPWVPPMSESIFVVGRIETTSPLRSEFPTLPLKLVILPPVTAAGGPLR